jgi:hypothetical protein
MSTYWSLHCKQCDLVSTDDGINHGQHILRSIYQLRDHIIAISDQDQSGYLSVEVMAHSAEPIWTFLKEHYDHEIDLQNEYGGTEPIVEEPEEPHASIPAK